MRVSFDWVTPALTRHAASVMHFFSSSWDIPSLITALDASVTATMWAHTRTDTGIVSYTVTPLDGTSASAVHATSGTKWFGQVTAGTDIVPQAAVLASHRTGVRGRSFRGRTYLPWPAESVCQSGSLVSGTLSTQQSAWDAFLAAMETASHELVVASYKLSNQAIVATTTIENLLATQRRRQPRPT